MADVTKQAVREEDTSDSENAEALVASLKDSGEFDAMKEQIMEALEDNGSLDEFKERAIEFTKTLCETERDRLLSGGNRSTGKRNNKRQIFDTVRTDLLCRDALPCELSRAVQDVLAKRFCGAASIQVDKALTAKK